MAAVARALLAAIYAAVLIRRGFKTQVVKARVRAVFNAEFMTARITNRPHTAREDKSVSFLLISFTLGGQRS